MISLLIKEGVHPMYPLPHPTSQPPYIGWKPTVSVHSFLSEDGENEKLSTLRLLPRTAVSSSQLRRNTITF
jgi:hypothetical protein